MVTHIVFFAFKPENKETNITKVKEQIWALQDDIETIKEMEIGINATDKERAMDMSLLTRFDDWDDLEYYAKHPKHLKVIEFIQGVVEYTKVVDYQG